MQTLTRKEDVIAEVYKELNILIKSGNIDVTTYTDANGEIDIKSLLRDCGMKF